MQIDVPAHQVTRDGVPIALTPLEFDLLVALARKPRQVFTRELLLEQVWGYRHAADTRLVNVHVQRLRAKIERDPEKPEVVLTVRGVGYKAGPALSVHPMTRAEVPATVPATPPAAPEAAGRRRRAPPDDDRAASRRSRRTRRAVRCARADPPDRGAGRCTPGGPRCRCASARSRWSSPAPSSSSSASCCSARSATSCSSVKRQAAIDQAQAGVFYAQTQVAGIATGDAVERPVDAGPHGAAAAQPRRSRPATSTSS